jgi:hypothetical protein
MKSSIGLTMRPPPKAGSAAPPASNTLSTL